MNNKLIFRILGALASALIIAAVFVPYINVLGDTVNLWDSYQTINSLYLPIMIIVFGGIGVLFFALNIKTEFAYITTGAISFFVVMQTIAYIDSFSALSLGYYFLVVGALLTGIMAFLCNLRPNNKVEPVQNEDVNNQPSMLDQIDKLYNEQQTQEPVQTIQPISIEPIQNIEPIQPISQVQENIQEVDAVAPVQVVENIQEPVMQQPIEEPITQQSEPMVQPVKEVQPELSTQSVNPVLQEFNFNSFDSEPQQPVQPQPVVQTAQEVQPELGIQSVNPVLQDFVNPSNSSLNNNFSNVNDVDVDIFGQPINK